MPECSNPPAVGDDIYVPGGRDIGHLTPGYILYGGKAKVTSVKAIYHPDTGDPDFLVYVVEHQDDAWVWSHVQGQQETLQRRYEGERAGRFVNAAW